MVYCTKCGAKNADDAVVCVKCGVALGRVSAPPWSRERRRGEEECFG
ncbi:MAG: zinc-ribbon domain-containing protein, partial [Candidatus Thorarchaeota archaeon]|nr:zinc-ribbon domain-containing protein [Candidatus Thorarchaeota archaeon]NIW14390.1 zinc-ribbon domain-containing protein [Candidatus Thorarchaeota archaeon]